MTVLRDNLKTCLSCGFIIKDTINLQIRKSKCNRCSEKKSKIISRYICPRCGNNLSLSQTKKQIMHS